MPIAALLLAAAAASAPTASLDNGELAVQVYLPDPARGFYRGTRFDWSGIISSLKHRGQEFHAPWYDRIDPAVRDFTDAGGEIVVSANSSATGPAEEFVTDGQALGFADAAPGGLFVKIGVGVLRRPDDAPYSPHRAYDIVDGGRWATRTAPTSVTFTQTLSNPASGYGYVYTKTLALEPGRPVLRIGHALRNTGAKPIRTSVYAHNFLVMPGRPTGPDFTVTAPYAITSTRPPAPELARIDGRRLIYTKPLGSGDRVFLPLEGFGPTAASYDFRVENTGARAGYTVQGDRPLSRAVLWSIRSNVSLEPFIDLAAAPGEETNWTYRYTYFAPPKG